MKIHLYTLCWNEANILGFFFRHYESWIDRYVVYDDGSTDGSLDILRAHPKVELRRFERTHVDSFVLSHQQMQNEVWKESRGKADWVVVTALDEHLQPSGWRMPDYLKACARAGVTLIPAIGYQMLSEDFPSPDERLAVSRQTGAPSYWMNKLSIFNPDAITETNFAAGRHTAELFGELEYPPRDEMMLLHYKYIGFERLIRRHSEQSTGLRPIDVKYSWGEEYRWPTEKVRKNWDEFAARALDIGQPGFRPWLNFEAPRWWRADDFRDAEPREGFRWLRGLGLRQCLL
jgi:glycosyltransferase involved in cell wall biosynthesis